MGMGRFQIILTVFLSLFVLGWFLNYLNKVLRDVGAIIDARQSGESEKFWGEFGFFVTNWALMLAVMAAVWFIYTYPVIVTPILRAWGY